jgi:hypothetical protein
MGGRAILMSIEAVDYTEELKPRKKKIKNVDKA